MSYQVQADLVKRVVNAQQELKSLKTTQILGGENMGYYEYNISGGSVTLGRYGTSWVAIVVWTNGAFPLASIELDIYENDTLIKNPWANAPRPYGAAGSGNVSYTFCQQDNAAGLMWMDDYYVEDRGTKYSFSDPRCFGYLIEMHSRVTDSRTIRFDNIKIRCTHEAMCFFTTNA